MINKEISLATPDWARVEIAENQEFTAGYELAVEVHAVAMGFLAAGTGERGWANSCDRFLELRGDNSRLIVRAGRSYNKYGNEEASSFNPSLVRVIGNTSHTDFRLHYAEPSLGLDAIEIDNLVGIERKFRITNPGTFGERVKTDESRALSARNPDHIASMSSRWTEILKFIE